MRLNKWSLIIEVVTDTLFPGVSTRSLFVEIQEHVHRKVMQLDFFAPWILTHGLIKGVYQCWYGREGRREGGREGGREGLHYGYHTCFSVYF